MSQSEADVFTADNILETMQASELASDFAYGFRYETITVGPLADGKRVWGDVFSAFKTNFTRRLTGYSSHKSFALAHGLRFRPNASSKTQLHNSGDILDTMLACQEDIGVAYESVDALIRHGPLANGQRRWLNVFDAFKKNNLSGFPHETSMQNFALYHGLKVPRAAQKPTPRRLQYWHVFNSTALHLLDMERSKQTGDHTVVDITKPDFSSDDLKTIFEYGALRPNAGRKYSFSDVIKMAREGKIQVLDTDFDLSVFATEVQARLLDGNFAKPTPFQIRHWMHEASRS